MIFVMSYEFTVLVDLQVEAENAVGSQNSTEAGKEFDRFLARDMHRRASAPDGIEGLTRKRESSNVHFPERDSVYSPLRDAQHALREIDSNDILTSHGEVLSVMSGATACVENASMSSHEVE